MSHGLVNGVFAVDMELACTDCGKKFWWSVSEQRDFADNDLPAPKRCKRCQGAKHSRKSKKAETSTSLVPVAPPQVPQLVSRAMPDESGFIEELRALVDEAHTDYPLREETFFERLFDSGNAAWEERCRRENAKQAVKQLLEREKTMLEGLKRVEVARADAETAIVRARTELLEAKLEQLEVQERFRRKLLRGADAKPDPATPTLQDLTSLKEELETRQQQEKYQRALRQRALADQAAISEFLDQVRQVFHHPQYEQSEKATRIRSLMDSFGKGLEDLPADVRRFLNRYESEGDE